jgi:transcriptional regulator with XRE-family HTH domain
MTDGTASAMFRNLGRTLALLRERKGRSQASVARQAKIGKSQLSKYERGRELPKLESLERILEALDSSYFVFFRVLEVIDRGGPSLPVDIDLYFARLMEGLFRLHRELVKEP